MRELCLLEEIQGIAGGCPTAEALFPKPCPIDDEDFYDECDLFPYNPCEGLFE